MLLAGCAPRRTGEPPQSQAVQPAVEPGQSSAPDPEPASLPEPEGPEPQEPEEEKAPDNGLRPALREAIASGDKLVALTFDDGPYEPSTRDMLELLRREDVLATYFLVGFNVDVFPELAAEVAANGHQIENHTYNHKELPDLDQTERAEEIESGSGRIEEATGVRTTMLRPPSGRLSEEVEAEAGMPIILWSVDPRDWATTDEDAICEHVLSHVQDGDIVILHDVYKATVRAVEKIIPALREEGFFFVTVSELIAVRGELEDGAVYTHLPPAAQDAEEEAPPQAQADAQPQPATDGPADEGQPGSGPEPEDTVEEAEGPEEDAA